MTGTKQPPADDGSSLAVLDTRFAEIMAAFDRVMNAEGKAPVAPELDPELERKLGEAMARFLASERAQTLVGPDGEGLDEALRTHLGPLLSSLFDTTHAHLKPHGDALKARREPPRPVAGPVRVDLSALFEEPDDDDAGSR